MKRACFFAYIILVMLLASGCKNQKNSTNEKQPTTQPTTQPTVTQPIAMVTNTVTEYPVPTVTKKSVTPIPKFEGVTLNWCLPEVYSEEKLNKSAVRINEVLDSLGRNYHISFSMADLSTYPDSVPRKEVDIAGFNNNGFHSTAAKELFLPLSDFLKDSELYRHYSEMLWESVSIDGTIYSIPNTGGYIMDGPLFVFNRKYFSEEQANEIVLSLDELEPVLKELKDRNVDCPLYFNTTAQNMVASMGSYERDNIVYSTEGDIVSLTESEDYCKVMDTLNRYAIQGLAKGPSKGNLMGSYLDELHEAYTGAQKAGTTVNLDNSTDYGIMITDAGWQGIYEDEVFVRTASRVISWIPLSFSAGIWSSSENPDYAFDFLSDFYLNTELQGIFFDPFDEDDKSKTLAERLDEHIIQSSLIGTRDFYLRDGNHANVPLGDNIIRFPYTGFIPEVVSDTSKATWVCSDYGSIWQLSEYDYFMNQYREKMKETGIDSVVEDIRKQFKEWKSRQ